MSARDHCKLLEDDLASMTGPIELGVLYLFGFLLHDRKNYTCARDHCKLLGDDLTSTTGPIELGEFCTCLVSCHLTGRTICLLETAVNCWETIWPA